MTPSGSKVVAKFLCLFYMRSYNSLARGTYQINHVNALVQDCSISTANAVEVQQSCTKASSRDVQ